jgi:hypothetical protein
MQNCRAYIIGQDGLFQKSIPPAFADEDAAKVEAERLVDGHDVDRAKTASEDRACFLSGISGWRAGSLYPLARGCRTSWRGEI